MNRFMTHKKISRELAIRALWSLDDYAFGHDKGSSDLYFSWAEENNLCPEWDGESEIHEEDLPPDFIELFIAIGVTPQEITEWFGINSKIFTPESQTRGRSRHREIEETLDDWDQQDQWKRDE